LWVLLGGGRANLGECQPRPCQANGVCQLFRILILGQINQHSHRLAVVVINAVP
jgi:hypothetical protein